MERRDTGRVTKRLFVRFGKGLPENIGFTGDVSPTGIFIRSSTVFEPGTFLAIELTLPNDRVLILSGRVMWAKRVPPNLARFVKKNGMGILLSQIPDDYHQFMKVLR